MKNTKMKNLIIIIYLIPVMLTGQSTRDTFDSHFFGFDFWSSNPAFWRAIYTQMEADTFPFDLVGSDAINWHKIEPNPPQNGVHHYNWQALDVYMQSTQEAGKVLELGIRPASNWGTVVKADDIDNWALGMSPLLPDERSDTLHWGMTAKQAWYDFMYNLVERYNYDHDASDAPWLNSALINTIIIGNEPEALSHFFAYGGTMQALHDMLAITKNALEDAGGKVILARGKSNSGRLFDDSPDRTTIMQRGGYYLDSLMADFEIGGEDYDVFAINYNDHYTQLPAFVDWLKKEMNKRGFEKPFIVGDARTTLCPRDNYYKSNERLLPPVYSREFMQTMEDPNDPQYDNTKDILQRDEVMQSIKKIVMAAYTGQKHVSLQPVYSNLVSSEPMENRKYMWYYSGFFDPYIFEKYGDLASAREPVYWAMKQLANQLIGSDRSVDRISLRENDYVFRFKKNGDSFFIAWHEDNTAIDDATGLRKRNQNTIIDLQQYITETKVKISHFIEKTNEKGQPESIPDTEMNKNHIAIDEFPLLIFPGGSTSTTKTETGDMGIRIYPNPFSDYIIVEMGSGSKAIFSLADSTGKTVKSCVIDNGSGIKLYTGDLQEGIYFLEIKTEGKVFVKKMVHLYSRN